MKNKKVIIGIIIVIALVIIGYIVLRMVQKNDEYWITDNEFLYDKAIEYIKNEIISNKYDKDNPTYKVKVFTDYEGFGITEKNDKKYAYMWILEESYYIYNGIMLFNSGSSRAYKFIFENNEVLKYETPLDGGYYESSMKKIFPKSIQNKILGYEMENTNVRKQADEYYKEIRNNEIIETYKENSNDNEKEESKKKLEEMKNKFNNYVDNLDTTIFLKDFENYNSVQKINTIKENEAKEIAQKGFEESAKRITGEGADNYESETIRIMEIYANNYFTGYYEEPSKQYEDIKRKCYVVTRENEIGNGIMIYVDMQTGLIIGGDAFGD